PPSHHYPLSLHDALPIYRLCSSQPLCDRPTRWRAAHINGKQGDSRGCQGRIQRTGNCWTYRELLQSFASLERLKRTLVKRKSTHHHFLSISLPEDRAHGLAVSERRRRPMSVVCP